MFTHLMQDLKSPAVTTNDYIFCTVFKVAVCKLVYPFCFVAMLLFGRGVSPCTQAEVEIYRKSESE